MDYLETPEGYGPSHIPFQPSQRQDTREQRPAAPKQQRPAPQQAIKQQAKMPKAQALAVARRMKQGIVVGSLLCFGTTVGLIINQTAQAQAQQATQQTTKSSGQTSSRSSTATSQSASSTKTASSTTPKNNGTTSSQSDSSTQAGTSSSQGTTSQQGGGYGFGSTNAGQPVSGSHTS